MDGITTDTKQEVLELLRANKVSDAIEVLSRGIEPASTITPHLFGFLSEYRSLPTSIATALRRNDFSSLQTRDLMDTLHFLRNSKLRTKKSDFLSTKAKLALHSLELAVQRQLEGDVDDF